MTVRLSLNFGRGAHPGASFLAGGGGGGGGSRGGGRGGGSRARPEPERDDDEKDSQNTAATADAGADAEEEETRERRQQQQQPEENDDPKAALRIAELEDELSRLRESTRSALQHSWDEVEALRRRASSAESNTAKLERKLEKCKGREEHWRNKCERLWHRLMNESGSRLDFKLDDEEHSDEEESPERAAASNPANRHTFLGGLRRTSLDMIRGNGGGNGNGNGRCSSSSAAEESAHREAMAAASARLHETQQQAQEQLVLVSQQIAQIEDLKEKLTSRDAVVETLEQTARAQSRALDALRSQLESVKAEGTDRESKMGEEICELRRRVQEKKLVIKEQCRKYEEAQGYIEEVTAELSRVYDEQEKVRGAAPSCEEGRGGMPQWQQQTAQRAVEMSGSS